MKPAQYAVIVQEHDSTEWDDGHLFTRSGAWKRVRMLARDIVPGWPHPIWCTVWRMSRDTRVLVYSADLRSIL